MYIAHMIKDGIAFDDIMQQKKDIFISNYNPANQS